MAESESIDCPCSNIAIMQLFHELKQRYPTVPDQLVSKIIQENYHDKGACETILQRESHAYLQTYPGAIISGNTRENQERGSLCTQCPAARPLQQNGNVTPRPQCAMPNTRPQLNETPRKTDYTSSSSDDGGVFLRKTSESGRRFPNRGRNQDRQFGLNKVDRGNELLMSRKPPEGESTKSSEDECDKNKVRGAETGKSLAESASETSIGTSATAEPQGYVAGSESGSVNSSRTCCSECDNERKAEALKRSHSCETSPSPKGGGYSEVETVRWNVEDGGNCHGGARGIITGPMSSGPISVHNYQVAVQYSMQPVLPLRQGDQQRSFTSVNLSLRPPSSEPQPPIEIQSGQNLTYTTSVFDAKKGVQSQLQIKIGPGGGGTVSACRTYISSPQSRYTCRSPYCNPQISSGFHCPNKHHLKALLEKQRERKDLLARELRKEKEKLRCMQNDVRLMKASIAQKPSPHILPKLKAEIDRLRAECERLTAAVDLYSDTQNSLPLGETDEEFYRNIYTGQRLQREGSWSCQLCTFRNHPLLSVCEECEMPRISLGTQVIGVASRLSNVLSNNNTSFCTGGGTSTSASLITAPLQER